MSIDFSGITAVSDKNGVVTQIADAQGNVLWALQSDKPVILEVEKITSDTYASETTYTGEQFILLDIYPKTNGTVSVTYGGLTKTITDTSGVEEPNAQQVYFGTFNGVSDEVETPASGTLTIEGGYVAFACSKHKYSKISSKLCPCVTAITDLGEVEYIPEYAFSYNRADTNQQCGKIASVVIPSSVTRIGHSSFGTAALEVTMLATTPPTLTVLETTNEDTGITSYTYAFYCSASLTIIVPKGCGDVYKAAWENYADYIVEAS